MYRRRSLIALAATAATALPTLAVVVPPPIVLLVDLEVDPAKEKTLLNNFRNTFRPAIQKQPGFVDVKLLHLTKEAAGKAPAGCNYRLLISFETEAQRLAWVATDIHQKVWPTIESCLKGQKFIALVYDPVP